MNTLELKGCLDWAMNNIGIVYHRYMMQIVTDMFISILDKDAHHLELYSPHQSVQINVVPKYICVMIHRGHMTYIFILII